MAMWYEPLSVKPGAPAEGDYDFLFNNSTGQVGIYKLTNGAWELYDTIAGSSSYAWTNATALNSWAIPNPDEWSCHPFRYRKVMGVVELHGKMKRPFTEQVCGTCSLTYKTHRYGEDYAFILPAGYRPDNELYLSILVNGITSQAKIGTDGRVTPIWSYWVSGESNCWNHAQNNTYEPYDCNVDNLRFMAFQ